MKTIKGIKIGLLGATSHIAKGLIYNFSRYGGDSISLFARQPDRVRDFLLSINCTERISVSDMNSFGKEIYDVVINCIGIGKPAGLKESPGAVFLLTEKHDNLVLDYLAANNKCLYVNFSSGAVYGKEFREPVSDKTKTVLDINNIMQEDLLGVAKINSEAKHKAFSGYNIVDLRVFAYFSRFIDLESGYFIAEVIMSAKNKKDFLTSPNDMVRDYIHHEDLFSLVEKCVQAGRVNGAYDIYSLKQTSKLEILNYFKTEYGLNYIIKENVKISSPTGSKLNYYSNSRKAETLGYRPKFTSMECIMKEAKYLMGKR